jgi:membrane AbrB-like protein
MQTPMCKKTTQKNNLKPFLFALGLSIGGAILFHLISFPLPWILGPLAILLITRYFWKIPLYWPTQLRNFALVMIGFFLGETFSVETANEILQHFPLMFLMTISTIGFCFLVSLVITYFSKIEFETTLIGSMPGGFSQMAVLGQELKTVDETKVILMQMIRILLIVFSIPFLTITFLDGQHQGHLISLIESGHGSGEEVGEKASVIHYLTYILTIIFGVWLAIKLRFPTPYLMGALIGTMVLVLLGVPKFDIPSPIFIAAQLCLGAQLGCGMNMSNLGQLRKLSMYTLISNIFLLIFSFIFAILIARWEAVSLATGVLSVAPGGVAEMGISAKEVGATISVVTGYQLFRVFFILLIVAPALKWWIMRRASR